MKEYINKTIDEFEGKLSKTDKHDGFLIDVGDDYEAVDYDTDLIVKFISSALQRQLELLNERIGRMKNHDEMMEMDSKEYTMGYEKSLSDIQSLLK